MSLNSAGITAGIAALSVAGVSIKDVSGVPATIAVRDTPILYPTFDNLVTGGNNEGNSTFGPAGSRFWQVNRTFRYLYLHCVAGAVRVPNDVAAAMLTVQDAMFEAIAEMDVSGVDVMSINFSTFGVFSDPAESQKFYGFTAEIGLLEKVNP